MKNVLIFAPLASYSPHFETDLELATLEKEAGNSVTILSCPSDLAYICLQRFKDINACIVCNSRKRNGLKIINGVKNVELKLNKLSPNIPNFTSIDEIKSFEHDGIKIGISVISTYISMYRETKLDFNLHGSDLRRSCSDLVRMTDSLSSFLDKKSFEKVYLFNGRFMHFYPLVCLLQKKGVHFFVHERAGMIENYSLTENTIPHDREYKKNEILNLFKTLSPERLRIDGEKWFNDRRTGALQGWFSYIDNQVKNEIPEEMKDENETITIFVSSEDEFEAMDGWKNTIYKNQNEGIVKILTDLPSHIKALVRIHPNLKNLVNTQTKELFALRRFTNCIIVTAEETVDSYAVLEASSKVITFGSTVGIEATFWGKPSILAGGRCLYEHLGACYTPTSHQEIMELISQKNLAPMPKEKSLIYGAWELNSGYPFKYFKPDSFSSGEFKGKQIEFSRLAKLLIRIRLRLQKIKILNWKAPFKGS